MSGREPGCHVAVGARGGGEARLEIVELASMRLGMEQCTSRYHSPQITCYRANTKDYEGHKMQRVVQIPSVHLPKVYQIDWGTNM
jgi:hypothetical protein